jgi:hypothetical protein
MTWAIKMADARYDGYDEGFEKGITTGREEGISIGLERGAYQTKLETAKLLLNYGDPPEKVALCTNLPLDVVQGLL